MNKAFFKRLKVHPRSNTCEIHFLKWGSFKKTYRAFTGFEGQAGVTFNYSSGKTIIGRGFLYE